MDAKRCSGGYSAHLKRSGSNLRPYTSVKCKREVKGKDPMKHRPNFPYNHVSFSSFLNLYTQLAKGKTKGIDEKRFWEIDLRNTVEKSKEREIKIKLFRYIPCESRRSS